MQRCALIFALAFAPVFAAEIVLPSHALERDGHVDAIYRTGALATGKGVLAVRWSDSYGRILASGKIPVQLTDENEITFPLPVYRAVAMKNTLEAHLTFDGVNKKGQPDHRDEDAKVDFVAKPPERKWNDYAIMMWQHRSTAQFAALKQVGINGTQFVGHPPALPDFVLDNNLRWYVENIATDFYSQYHRYFGDRPNQWEFLQVREEYQKDPSSLEPFKRHPSLSDPVWLKKVHDRVVDRARFYSAYRPFFYNLADESGIADLAAYWDFDFSDQSLEAMRTWLEQRYGTLEALNAQWGTNFTAWHNVIPQTTDQAMKRTDDNYSSWSDFKEWMDIAYARALKMGTDAVHSVDPDAYVGIEGAQMPGWGGYDYSRLVKSVTAMEPYDIGNNIDLVRSFDPSIAMLTTSFRGGPWERHRIWYELLHGTRGSIIWDDKSAFVNSDNTLGPRAKETEPYYTELRNGIGAQIIGSERVTDPIAIHYSQPSMRIEWMLAQRSKGPAWAARTSSTERRDSEFLALREAYCRIVDDQGLQYNFVSYGQVQDGDLVKSGYKVLILPRSSALSAAEAANIRDFAARGGTVIADGMPGVFDEHDHRLPSPQLAELFDTAGAGPYTTHTFGRGKGIFLKTPVTNYYQLRLMSKEAPVQEMFTAIFHNAGVHPRIAATDAAGKPITGLAVYTFRNGGATILGLMSNPELRVNELGPPEFRSNERFAKPITAHVTLPADAYVYDMRAGTSLGKKRELTVTVQPYEPSLLSLTTVPLPDIGLSVPDRAARGSDVRIGIRMLGPLAARMHTLHLDVIDPAGKVVDYYSGNLLATSDAASKLVPLAYNDAAGRWSARVHDLLSGQTKTEQFEVY